MREVRKIDNYDRSQNIVRVVHPIDHPRFDDYCDNRSYTGERHFVRRNLVTPDQDYLCWCNPARSRSSMKQYKSVPVDMLDMVEGMHALNYLLEHDNDLNNQFLGHVLDGFEEMRPDGILGVESKVAHAHTLEFLAQEGYSEGQSVLNEGTIVYLGTYGTTDGNIKGVGRNGVVFVTNVEDEYVGPIFIHNQKRNAGARSIYEGLSLRHLDPEKDYGTIMRALGRLPTRDTKLDGLVRTILDDKLTTLFPDKIITQRSGRVNDRILGVLGDMGYDRGQALLREGTIVYVDVRPTPGGYFSGKGTNGMVFVDNTDAPFIGPVFVYRKKDDRRGRTIFEGRAVANMHGRELEDMREMFVDCPLPSKSIRLNHLIRDILLKGIQAQ
jgi:hypothetical protein